MKHGRSLRIKKTWQVKPNKDKELGKERVFMCKTGGVEVSILYKVCKKHMSTFRINIWTIYNDRLFSICILTSDDWAVAVGAVVVAWLAFKKKNVKGFR